MTAAAPPIGPDAGWPDETTLRVVAAVARRFARWSARFRVLDLDDLRQEALAALWLRRLRRPDDPAGVTLSHRIATSACQNAVRKARGAGRGLHADADADRRIDVVEPGANAPDPDAPLDVAAAVARLTPALRSTVRDKLAGLSGPEIARKDAVSPKTVETRVVRSFAALRELLDAYAPARPTGGSRRAVITVE